MSISLYKGASCFSPSVPGRKFGRLAVWIYRSKASTQAVCQTAARHQKRGSYRRLTNEFTSDIRFYKYSLFFTLSQGFVCDSNVNFLYRQYMCDTIYRIKYDLTMS